MQLSFKSQSVPLQVSSLPVEQAAFFRHSSTQYSTHYSNVFIVFRQLFIGVDAKDDNYMPHHVVVMGGDSQSNLKEIGEVFIES